MVWEMNGSSVATSFTLPNPGAPWKLEDDGPIPSSEMGSGSGQPTLRSSAPDAAGAAQIDVSATNEPLAFAPAGNGLAGSLQTNNQPQAFVIR
jgi:hypothetical protein